MARTLREVLNESMVRENIQFDGSLRVFDLIDYKGEQVTLASAFVYMLGEMNKSNALQDLLTELESLAEVQPGERPMDRQERLQDSDAYTLAAQVREQIAMLS